MYQTQTSQQDWQRFRDLEKKRHQSYFLPKYDDMQFDLVKDISDDIKTNEYDVVLRSRENEQISYVEEKTRTGKWDHLLVEIMQCIEDGRLGWLYKTKADYILDAQFLSEEDDLPHTVYWVDFQKLKAFVIENFEQLSGATSSKGYGLTYFKRATWVDLEFLGIARKI